ncbi:MAG: FAD-binding oxidoreductase [Gemmatimonadaceae bacterium]
MKGPTDFSGVFRDDADARAVYSESAGIARVLPRAVAVPRDAEDVARLVRWARESGTPLVARGSGSSMGNGAVGPGVVVDLSRIDHVGPVDAERRVVRVGPGALRGAVDRAARARGLRFPVDPSSGAFCTVGGMAACNAAGARTLKHGATRAWVEAIDCVFDDGARREVRRGDELTSYAGVPALERFVRSALQPLFAAGMAEPVARIRHTGVRKDSSGYAIGDFAHSGSLVDLLVGSEGTLALFVELELRLAPLAGATTSVLAAFHSLEAAVDGAARARELGASACELLDRTFLDVARQGDHPPDVPAEAEAVLLAELEAGDAAEGERLARALAAAFGAAGASKVQVALSRVEEERLWHLRHAASPILARLDPHLASMQFVEDGAVPPEMLPAYVRGVRDVLERHGVRGVIFGHAGDAHVHVNPLVDLRQPRWRDQVAAVLDEVVALTARLGGTLSGEHGDGRLRAPLADRVWTSDATTLFALVKNAFDPTGILNPGVKIALPGQRALEDVKYDPALPPLPDAARAALATVYAERAYQRFRLDLLDGRGAGAAPTAAPPGERTVEDE